MLKTITTILLSLAVCVTACNHGQSPAAPRGELSGDEYDVLSAFIAAEFNVNEGKKRTDASIVKLIIVDTTESGDDDLLPDEKGQAIPWEKRAKSLRQEAPTLQQSTIDAFRKVNARPAFFRRSLHSPIDYELVSSAQLGSIFKRNRDGWSTYYKQFPHASGILTFSRVGFSPDGTQAFLYLSSQCGSLCGGGRYVVMDHRSGRWAIAQDIEMWIS